MNDNLNHNLINKKKSKKDMMHIMLNTGYMSRDNLIT